MNVDPVKDNTNRISAIETYVEKIVDTKIEKLETLVSGIEKRVEKLEKKLKK